MPLHTHKTNSAHVYIQMPLDNLQTQFPGMYCLAAPCAQLHRGQLAPSLHFLKWPILKYPSEISLSVDFRCLPQQLLASFLPLLVSSKIAISQISHFDLSPKISILIPFRTKTSLRIGPLALFWCVRGSIFVGRLHCNC